PPVGRGRQRRGASGWPGGTGGVRPRPRPPGGEGSATADPQAAVYRGGGCRRPPGRAGLRPGDIITAIDGLPPFVRGVADQAVLAQLDDPATIHVTVRWPGAGRTMTVTLSPAPYPSPQPVTARVLSGGVAYVQLTSF